MIARFPRAEETLEIRLLGTLSVALGGRPHTLPASRKTRGLLAYLALAAAPCHRADLCDLLWDNVADPRGELRWSLSKIKAALGPFLVTTMESVSIEKERLVVDANLLRSIAAGSITSCASGLAGTLWRGEPLSDLWMPDRHRYHLWWLAVREELTALHGQLLHAAVEQAWPSPPDALAAARALVAQRPFDATGHVRVAQALARSGRTAEANAYLAEARLVLSAELGVPPVDVIEAVAPFHASRDVAGAMRRKPMAPPLIVLEQFDQEPPTASIAPIAALAAAHLVEGLWRGRVCEVLDANHFRPMSASHRHPAAVRFVIRGSMLKLPEGLRLTLRCVDARSGVVLWCGQFALDASFSVVLRRRLDQAVVALEAAIRQVEMNDDGQEEFADRARLVGMLALAHTLDSSANTRALRAAYAFLEESEDEPIALAVAAWCHAQRAVYNWSADVANDRRESKRLATAATRIDLDDPNCLTIIAAARTMVGDLTGAGSLLDRALKLNPGCARAYSRKGWLANYSDQPDLAVHCFRTALALMPGARIEFNNLIGLGVAHFIRNDYERATRYMERGLALNPKATWVQRNLVPAYAAAGRHAEAAAGLDSLLQEHEGLNVAAVESAMVFSPPVMRQIAEGLAGAGLPRA